MDYNDIFGLPERLLARKVLTKAFFTKNFDLSSGEKRLLKEQISSMEILSQLNIQNSNIPAVKTNEYNYEDILIIVCRLNDTLLEKYGEACVEMIQRHIPRQILLLIADNNEYIINTCNKRINQNDKSKVVIEEIISTNKINKLYKQEITEALYDGLSFANIDKTNIESAYKAYIHAIVGYKTACVTGYYSRDRRNSTEEDRLLLAEIEQLEAELVGMSNQMQKETQIADRVELNIQIHEKRKAIEEIKIKLI